MTLGLRGKLFLSILGLIAISVIAAEVYLSVAVEGFMVERIRDDLTARLRLIERDASLLAADASDVVAWDAFADAVGTRAAARVTIVDGRGAVIGDSEVPVARLRDVENHALRPEIVEALGKGRGASTRYSTTVEKRMMYVAAPILRGAEVAGVVRIALSLSSVEEVKASLRRILAVGAGVALLLAALLAIALASWIARPVRDVTRVARAMAGGDLGVRTRATGRDEVSEMGRALDALAGGLAESLAALGAERDRLSDILEGMTEGVLTVGRDDRIALANRALREMLLLAPDVEGRALLEAIRHAALKALIDHAAATDDATAEGEIEVGGMRPRRLLVHATRLSGESAGVLAVFVDVTNLRRLESLRKEFVANASHELRTPIAVIQSACETLANVPSGDEAARVKFFEIISRNTARLAHLVGDLLDLSRIESREWHMAVEAVDVAPVVERVLEAFRERADKRGMRLCAELAAAVSIRADARALEQVVTNLVDNAVKYASEGTSVVVNVAHDGESVRIVVADEGPGIAPTHLPHLFERFYRVDAGRSRDLGGTGLGLSIVKNLVEAMGGTVAVESRVGAFTRFSVSLPA